MKRLKILVLMHESLVPPDSIAGLSDTQIQEFKTEYDVLATLQNMGHDARALGILDDLGNIRRTLREWSPNIAFNLMEEFNGVGVYDQHVVSFLELMQQPYTGCNPRGLMLAHDKSLAKKILTFHRIRTPNFFVVPIGRRTKRPKALMFPLLVKSVSEEASLGITTSSIVHDDQSLLQQVEHVHQTVGTDALVEAYIEGRELYVGIIGNQRLTTFPIWELKFTKAPSGLPQIATARVKWDYRYQEKLGVQTTAASDLDATTQKNILQVCKRVYHALSLSGYARIDLRLSPEGKVYVLEANPNPNLAYGEDFAESAAQAGLDYETLLQRILNLGLSYQAEWRD
jgi:D-alanine-D-alanine ligase